MKVLSVILGVLVIIAGITCICYPASGFSTIVMIAGIAMMVEGIGSICAWNDRRKVGDSSGWTLAGGIISLIVGLAVIIGPVAGLLAATIIIYFVVAWLIVVGIMRIVAAIKLRKFNKENNIQNPVVSWVAMLILGILMIIVGICGIVVPLYIAGFLSIMLGICVIAGGCGLISVAFAK